MGMYDYVLYQGKKYQTKDFYCEMLDYYIEDGRLLKSIGHLEDMPDDEKPMPGTLFGCLRWIEESREDINFHGILDLIDDALIRYKAKFTDGDLVEIRETSDDTGL